METSCLNIKVLPACDSYASIYWLGTLTVGCSGRLLIRLSSAIFTDRRSIELPMPRKIYVASVGRLKMNLFKLFELSEAVLSGCSFVIIAAAS